MVTLGFGHGRIALMTVPPGPSERPIWRCAQASWLAAVAGGAPVSLTFDDGASGERERATTTASAKQASSTRPRAEGDSEGTDGDKTDRRGHEREESVDRHDPRQHGLGDLLLHQQVPGEVQQAQCRSGNDEGRREDPHVHLRPEHQHGDAPHDEGDHDDLHRPVTVTLARKNAATNTPTAWADLARPHPSLPIVSSAITGPSTLMAPLTRALKTSAADAAGITQPSCRA